MTHSPSPPDGGGPVLGIETATAQGSVALGRGGEVLGELTLHNPRTHSEKLLPAVETLLTSVGVTPADLSAVAVSSGPGSFTGLRIGLAAAKGLAFSLGIPLYGIPTLEVLAANALPGKNSVCAVLDARRGEVFAALFRFREGRLIPGRKAGVFRPADLVPSLPRGTVICGKVSALFPATEGKRSDSFTFAPAHLNYPRAAVVALRGVLLAEEEAVSETATLVPFYLRPSDAEANRAAQLRRRKKKRERTGAEGTGGGVKYPYKSAS